MSPRRIADDGIALLSGDHSGVLADFEGRVRLASRNLFPNGDLDDSDENGGLDGWQLEAPPNVVGWFPYYADEPGEPFYRQLFEALPIGTRSWKLDDQWIRGAEPPDATSGARSSFAGAARVGAPRAFAVDLVPLAEIGFAAGSYQVAINYGVGSPWGPARSRKWTECSTFVQVTVPTVGMGIAITLPERPDGVTFMGVFLSRPNQSASTARLQQIVLVRYGVRESIKLRGPWRNGPAPPAANRTYIGNLGQIDPPLVRRGSRDPGDRSHHTIGGLQSGQYQFRVLLKTPFGWTMPSQPTNWITVGDRKHSTALWITPRPIPHVPVEVFGVEVRGQKLSGDRETPWQRVVMASSRSEWRTGRWVDVHGWHNGDGMPPRQRLESGGLSGGEEDESGVPKPELELEIPTTFGGAPLGPGRKRLKATWAYRERDDAGRAEERESPPSPMVTVDVPGAAGAATHTIRYFRPPGMNEERNPLFVNLKQDQTEQEWVRNPAGASGATFLPQHGYVEVTDRTARTTTETVYYSAAVDVTDGRQRAIRMSLEMPAAGYVSGQAVFDVQFLNAAGAVLGTYYRLARIDNRSEGPAGLYREYAHATIGAPNSEADIEWPVGTTHYRRRFQHVGGSSAGARNFVVIYKDIGAYPGVAHPLKRFDFGEAERYDEQDFPPNAYITILEGSLVDEERLRPRQNTSPWVREVIDFDAGIPADLTLVSVGDGTSTVSSRRRISGTQSLRCVATSSGSVARASFDAGSTRTTIAAICKVRVVQTSAQDVEVFRLGNCAKVQVAANGDLQLITTNASQSQTLTTLAGEEVDETFEYNLEIAVEGLGSSAGKVRYYRRRGGTRRRQVAEHTAINLTGDRNIRFIQAGVVSKTGASQAVVVADEIEVFQQDIWEDVPGRMIEYWAAEGTPQHFANGMSGHRVLVDGGQTQIVSVFAEIFGASPASPEASPTSLLHFDAKDERGEVVARYGDLVPSASGRKRMRRYWQRITWPADARYIEFTGNELGAGLVRIAGFQLEGDTADGRPTPFTNQHVADGYGEVEFNTRVPGVPAGSVLEIYNRIAAYRSATAHAASPEETSVTVSFAASDDRSNYPDLTTDLSTVALAEWFKIRADLHTDDLEVTPELGELVLDFVREDAVVCRADGTEVPGGAVPMNFPAVQDVPRIELAEYADNTLGYTSFGARQPRADGWTLEAYYDEGVRALAGEIGAGESVLIVEERGVRHHCQIFNLPIPPPDRRIEHWIEGRERGSGGFIFFSDEVEALVLDEEAL